MKVKSNLKSGSMVEDTRQVISNLNNQVGDFFYTAQKQAKGVTGTAGNAVSSLRSGVADLIGIA